MRILTVKLEVTVTSMEDVLDAVRDLQTLLADSPWGRGIGLICIDPKEPPA